MIGGRVAPPPPFWLDQPDAPGAAAAAGRRRVEADLLVVGGGLTGLWTALQAAEEGKSVVLLEGERLAFGASGRNGGFCDASLTHGLGNGLARWPDEMETLERMGRENLDGDRATIARHGIDCGWEPTGTIAVATAPHQLAVAGGGGGGSCGASAGRPRCSTRDGGARAGRLADLRRRRARTRDGCALVDPARLCWGLARAPRRRRARRSTRARR